MSGPWEDYASQDEAGPWADYAQPSVGLDVAKQLGAGLVRGAEMIPEAPAALLGMAGRGLQNILPASMNNQQAASQQEQIRNLAAQARGGGISQYLPEPQTTAGQYARTAAEFLPSAGMAPGGLARNLVAGTAAGLGSEAAGQATQGTAAEPYARIAAALAAPTALGSLSRLVTPLPAAAARQPALQTLAAEGVVPTAGQRTGSKGLQYLESSLSDLPGAGRGAATATERTAEQFTAATLRRAGENANRATPEVIDRAFDRIGNQFDTLGQRNTLRADPQFGQDIQAAITDYHNLVAPPNRAPAVENFLTEMGTALQRNAGTLPGDVFQSLSSRIEKAARGARGTPEVAGTLRDMRQALNDAMERSIAQSNPRDLGTWQQTRNQYRNMLVIEKAASGAGEGAAQGLISPSQLRNATVQQNRRAYVRGQGDFGDLARAGEAVLKPLPQSGTAPRVYAMHTFPTALGAFAGGAPGALVGAMAPPLVGRALMSRPIQAYLGNQLLPRVAPGPLAKRLLRRAIISAPAARGILPD